MGEHKTIKKNFKLVSNSMHKKCSNTKFFLVRILPHSDWIRRDTKSAKNFKITLAKTPWNSPPKKKFGPENKWFKTSYLKFIFYFRFFSIIQFRSKNVAHFTTLNSLDIVKMILPQHIVRPYSLYKFSSKHFWLVSEKKHLHCTISRTAFSKHFQSKCLYISVYLRKNIIVPKT